MLRQHPRMAQAAAIEALRCFSRRGPLPEVLKNAQSVSSAFCFGKAAQRPGLFLPPGQGGIQPGLQARWRPLIFDLVWLFAEKLEQFIVRLQIVAHSTSS